MIFYLYIAIWVCLGTIFTYKEYKSDGWGYAAMCAVGSTIMGACIVAIVSLLTTIVVSEISGERLAYHNVHPIVSLRSESTVQGSFFLGCGSVGTSEHYYFMRDLGDGRYQRDNEYCYDTVLRETDSEKPSLSYDVYTHINPNADFWWPRRFQFAERRRRDITLTVPKGTVIQRFEVK